MFVVQRGHVVAAALVLAGCGGSPDNSSAPGIYGTWQYVGSPFFQSLSLNQDGTYVHSRLEAVTQTSFDGQIETGTFTLATDGRTMYLTPKMWTCSGPFLAYSATYNLSGGALLFMQGSTILDFARDTQPANTATGVALAEGCFTSTGFVQRALASVTP